MSTDEIEEFKKKQQELEALLKDQRSSEELEANIGEMEQQLSTRMQQLEDEMQQSVLEEEQKTAQESKQQEVETDAELARRLQADEYGEDLNEDSSSESGSSLLADNSTAGDSSDEAPVEHGDQRGGPERSDEGMDQRIHELATLSVQIDDNVKQKEELPSPNLLLKLQKLNSQVRRLEDKNQKQAEAMRQLQAARTRQSEEASKHADEENALREKWDEKVEKAVQVRIKAAVQEATNKERKRKSKRAKKSTDSEEVTDAMLALTVKHKKLAKRLRKKESELKLTHKHVSLLKQKEDYSKQLTDKWRAQLEAMEVEIEKCNRKQAEDAELTNQSADKGQGLLTMNMDTIPAPAMSLLVRHESTELVNRWSKGPDAATIMTSNMDTLQQLAASLQKESPGSVLLYSVAAAVMNDAGGPAVSATPPVSPPSTLLFPSAEDMWACQSCSFANNHILVSSCTQCDAKREGLKEDIDYPHPPTTIPLQRAYSQQAPGCPKKCSSEIEIDWDAQEATCMECLHQWALDLHYKQCPACNTFDTIYTDENRMCMACDLVFPLREDDLRKNVGPSETN